MLRLPGYLRIAIYMLCTCTRYVSLYLEGSSHNYILRHDSVLSFANPASTKFNEFARPVDERVRRCSLVTEYGVSVLHTEYWEGPSPSLGASATPASCVLGCVGIGRGALGSGETVKQPPHHSHTSDFCLRSTDGVWSS